MNKFALITTGLIVAFLSGCSEKTETVEWYIEHPDKLAKEFEKCKDKSIAELTKDKHCAVIRKAHDQAFNEHQRNAPLPEIKFK